MRSEGAWPASLRWGLALLGFLSFLALAAPAGLPDPRAIDVGRVLDSPSGDHWLGTDGLGRDVAARLAQGGRVSLAIGLLTAGIALACGVPLGALAGYAGGLADALVSRVVEAVLCFPGLLVALAVLAAAPPALRALPDEVRLAAVLGALGWPAVARYVRGEVSRFRSSPAVDAARASGAGPVRVLVCHVLPAATAPITVGAAFAVGSAILAEAGLSFLGLGIAPPTASWGSMLAEARESLGRAWWMLVFPGAALFATVLACNLAADGVREAFDPRRHER